jgi:diguanylate cyclase (GGDEF)-like protein
MKKKTRAPKRKAAKPRKGQAAPRTASPRTSRPDRTKATIRRLREDLAKALDLVETLQASVERDFLLGILNRRGFERELDRVIAYIKRYHANGALIVLDVDRLKPINDAFGHAAGDQVLKAVVGAIISQVRASDIVGRLGGDEFAVLLWNLSETDARAKAAALEAAIDRLSFAFDGRVMMAGASAGVAILGTHSEAAATLEEADRAMYVRKAQRRHEPHTAATTSRGEERD